MARHVIIRDWRSGAGSGPVIHRVRIGKNEKKHDAIPRVAAQFILSEGLGALSMNWYIKDWGLLRVYTGLVKIVGQRRKHYEYAPGGNGHLEVCVEGEDTEATASSGP